MKPGKEQGAIIFDREREFYIAAFAVKSLNVDIHWGLSQFLRMEGDEGEEMSADEIDITLLALRKFNKDRTNRKGQRKMGRWMIEEIKSTRAAQQS